MAYTDDAVENKLATLNEAQDSIVTVAQWIMFHRRHAERTAHIWLKCLRKSGYGKRLYLIYLVNEVVQQSKARRKDDFDLAFSPLVPEAAVVAYKGAPVEIQHKVRRVVEVWRQRQVFGEEVLQRVEQGINGVDREAPPASATPGKRRLLGNSLFGTSNQESGSSSSSSRVPDVFQPLLPLHSALAKSSLSIKPAANEATKQYESITQSNNAEPAPRQAAKYSSALKALAAAENAVNETLRTRQTLLEQLEKIIEDNKREMSTDKELAGDLASKKIRLEEGMKAVEDSIVSSLGTVADADTLSSSNDLDAQRPEVEGFTPPGSPPSEASLPQVPAASSQVNGDFDPHIGALPDMEVLAQLPASHISPMPSTALSEKGKDPRLGYTSQYEQVWTTDEQDRVGSQSGKETLGANGFQGAPHTSSTGLMPSDRHRNPSPTESNSYGLGSIGFMPSLKKRKYSKNEEEGYAEFLGDLNGGEGALDGLDDEVRGALA